MLTTKHLCLLSIAALSLAAVTPALAGPGVEAMLKGNSPATGDPGITLVAKRPGSPRAIQDANERRRRAIGDPGIKLRTKNFGNPRAFNPQPDTPGKWRAGNPRKTHRRK